MILTTHPENLVLETFTAKVVRGYESLPKTVTGADTNNNSEPTAYRLTEYTYKHNGETITTLTAEQQLEFDADKAEIQWCFWVSGGLMDSTDPNKKEWVQISNRTAVAESSTDFTLETDKDKFKKAIEDNGYLHASTEVVTENGKKINKLTITFSKWLDEKNVYVEPFRNAPGHKESRAYVKTTAIKATPELINVYWTNQQNKFISSTGYNTTLNLHIVSLGLQGKSIVARLFDDDTPEGTSPTDDLILWNNTGTYEDSKTLQITNRLTTLPYAIEGPLSAAFANAHEVLVEGNKLELYLKFTSIFLDSSVFDTHFGALKLTNQSTINRLFFAEKITFGSGTDTFTRYVELNTVFPGMSAYLVAEATNLNGTNVTFSITENQPLLLTNSTDPALPLLVGGVSQTEFSATLVDDFAALEVTFQELGSTTYIEWNDKLDTDSEEGLASKLIIKAQIDSQEYLSTDEFNLKSSTIRYIIKNDGITKHHREVSNRARYIFKENSGTLHYLTEADFNEINQHNKNYIYAKPKAQLTDIRNVTSHDIGDVTYDFAVQTLDSERYYIDIDCLASLIAAMIEAGIENLRFNGASQDDGRPNPSASHWNGMVVDLGYISVNMDGSGILLYTSGTTKLRNPNFDYDRQVLFNNALYKYGFSKFRKNDSSVSESNKTILTEKFKLTETDTEFTVLPHAIHKRYTTSGGKLVRHDNHLHVSGLDISFFEIKID